jgi:hypothetical protein
MDLRSAIARSPVCGTLFRSGASDETYADKSLGLWSVSGIGR